MVQEFHAVKCFQCQTFQVQLAKKSNKWSCTLCGAKQSLQHIFARSSSAKNCRLLVQQYNAARGSLEDEALWDEGGGGGGHQQQRGWGDDQPAQRSRPEGAASRWEGFAEEGENAGCTVVLPQVQAPPPRQQQQQQPPAKRHRGQQQQQQQPLESSAAARSHEQPFMQQRTNTTQRAQHHSDGGWAVAAAAKQEQAAPVSGPAQSARVAPAPVPPRGRRWNEFVEGDD